MLSINQFCHDCMSHFIIALAATKYMGFKNVYGWLSHCNVDTSGSCTSMVAELGPSRGSLSFSSPWREGLTTSTSSMWTTTKIPWKNTERTALTIQFISGWFVLQPHPWFWFNSANVQARSLSGGTLDRGVPRLMLALSTFKLIDWWMMQSSWDLRFDWDLSLTDRMLKFKVTCTWDVSDLSRLRSSTFPKWKTIVVIPGCSSRLASVVGSRRNLHFTGSTSGNSLQEVFKNDLKSVPTLPTTDKHAMMQGARLKDDVRATTAAKGFLLANLSMTEWALLANDWWTLLVNDWLTLLVNDLVTVFVNDCWFTDCWLTNSEFVSRANPVWAKDSISQGSSRWTGLL